MMRSMEEIQAEHMRAAERTLVIVPVEGKHALSSTGIVSYKMATGEPNYKITQCEITNLWIFKQNYGVLPEKLKQRFTSYSQIMKFAHDYFGRRNLKIEKILD